MYLLNLYYNNILDLFNRQRPYLWICKGYNKFKQFLTICTDPEFHRELWEELGPI